MLVHIAVFIDVAAIAFEVYYLYFGQSGHDTAGLLNFRLAIPVVNLIFLLLASRGISKDDKLVKSYDRLR